MALENTHLFVFVENILLVFLLNVVNSKYLHLQCAECVRLDLNSIFDYNHKEMLSRKYVKSQSNIIFNILSFFFLQMALNPSQPVGMGRRQTLDQKVPASSLGSLCWPCWEYGHLLLWFTLTWWTIKEFLVCKCCNTCTYMHASDSKNIGIRLFHFICPAGKVWQHVVCLLSLCVHRHNTCFFQSNLNP